jgi:hypothetical protein
MVNIDLLNIESSEFDSRDLVIESINHPKFEFPAQLDYRPDMPVAWNQGADGPCSAYAAAAIKMWQEYKDYGSKEGLSQYFVYNLRPNYPAKGMTPRNTMRILKDYGIPYKKSFKLKWKKVEEIPAHVLEEAANHKILGYARVMTIEGLKKSLYKNGPAYIAMPVFNDSAGFWKPKYNDRLLGGHALVVVGYNDKGFILRNSWGIGWGDNGHSIYPYQDFGAHYEIWTSIDDESSKPVIGARPPKRTKQDREGTLKKFISIFKKN